MFLLNKLEHIIPHGQLAFTEDRVFVFCVTCFGIVWNKVLPSKTEVSWLSPFNISICCGKSNILGHTQIILLVTYTRKSNILYLNISWFVLYPKQLVQRKILRSWRQGKGSNETIQWCARVRVPRSWRRPPEVGNPYDPGYFLIYLLICLFIYFWVHGYVCIYKYDYIYI